MFKRGIHSSLRSSFYHDCASDCYPLPNQKSYYNCGARKYLKDLVVMSPSGRINWLYIFYIKRGNMLLIGKTRTFTHYIRSFQHIYLEIVISH